MGMHKRLKPYESWTLQREGITIMNDSNKAVKLIITTEDKSSATMDKSKSLGNDNDSDNKTE